MNAVVRSRKDSGNLFNKVNRLRMGSQGKKKPKFPIDNCDLVLTIKQTAQDYKWTNM